MFLESDRFSLWIILFGVVGHSYVLTLWCFEGAYGLGEIAYGLGETTNTNLIILENTVWFFIIY